MTEKEQQFNKWFDEYANGVKVFEEADMKQAYLQGWAELEKENAELKETVIKMNNVITETFSNLTKAKEIIRDLLNLPFASNEEVFADVNSHLDRAEQFLKDSEVEK